MFAPDRQGFFPGLWVQLLQDLSTADREAFASLATRAERLQWMYDRSFVKARLELLRDMRLGGGKDEAGSSARREAGNAQFLAGDTAGAMVSYTRAVVLGPPRTQTLAAAFANRAACLQRLGCPEFALTDLELAAESGYQRASMFKLLERRAQCLVTLRRYKEARVAFEEALDAVKLAKLDRKKKEKFHKDIQSGLEKIDQEMTSSSSPLPSPEPGGQKEAILTVDSPSNQFPSASSVLEVRHQKGRGRFVVAATDIPVGTTLLSEKPITWALHPDRYGSHCQECMGQVKSVIPCSHCTGVSFCSVACRDLAAASYHRYECGANNILTASGLNIYPALTLRLISRFDVDRLWELRDELSEHNDTVGATTDAVYTQESFVNAFNLVCHEDKMTEEEQLLRTFVAVFLLKLLQFNNYFGTLTETETFATLSERELFIGGLCLHFMICLPQNVHDIAVLETSETKRWVNSAEIKSLGAGVFLTGALFNHSCDPSFMRCNVGKGLVSVANRNISAGEEVSECYGQMYYTKNTDTRRQQLRDHYKFECQCPACLDNYPTIKELQYASGGEGATKHAHLVRVKCGNTDCGQVLDRVKGVRVGQVVTCLVCGQETQVAAIPLQEIKEASVLAARLLCEQLDWAGGVAAVRACQQLYDRHLVPPSIELYNTQISIWRAMWMIVGNKKIKKSII